ncbi:MAG: rhodanese-like domain-containing protein [Verrucomicrobiota bacterium]
MTTAVATTTAAISGKTTMAELEATIPGARRALFSRYHIGGCSSCGFQPEETLAEVCARNENVPVDEVVAHLEASHENDLKMQIEPADLKTALEGDSPPKLIDLRTREEFDAVRIGGAEMFSEDLQQSAFGTWPKDTAIVLYDHKGPRALDAAAYFTGHGFESVKALAGGIDRYSAEVDASLPRYQVEFG